MQRVERSHRRLARQILGAGEPFPARMPTESKTASVPRTSVFPLESTGIWHPNCSTRALEWKSRQIGRTVWHKCYSL
jgi:hypothetical protein